MKTKSLPGRIIANWPAKILALVVALLIFVIHRVNNLQERTLEIPIELVLPSDLLVSAPFQNKVNLTMKGDRGEAISILTAADFRALVDLSLYSEKGEYSVAVRIVQHEDSLNSNVYVDRMEPEEIRVSIDYAATKVVPIVVSMKGVPKIGYYLATYSLLPERVKILGPASRVESLSEVTTEPVDLTGKAESFAAQIGLSLQNEYLEFTEVQSTEFRGIIREERAERRFSGVSLVPVNLDPSLVMEPIEEIGVIRIEGMKLFLDSMDDSMLILRVDFSEIRGPGEYTLSVEPFAPSQLVILEYRPEKIVVRIDRRQQ